MKTLTIKIVAILVSSLLFFSCAKDKMCINGSGTITTKTLSISDFTGINFCEAGNVVIRQGEVQEVQVTGHPNILSKLETRVSNKVWEIKLEKGCYENYELTVEIIVPDLDLVAISGAGDATIHDFSDQNDLSLIISGVGVINLNKFNGCENLSINISGNGTIKGNSACSGLEKLDVHISGAGNIDGYPLITNDCNVNISGTGNCYTYVTRTLDVSISGSGKVFYKGNPTISYHGNNAGSIINMN